MAAPPSKRQRSFARPFPTLALLAIYSATPVKGLTSPAGRQDDATVEASKILFFSAHEELKVERKARLMGTVMGMADFARMLTPGGGPSVRAVHSSKQRMVWLEPEKGFFVHASIDLPYTPRHTRGVSSATTTSNGSAGNDGAAQLEDEALLAALEEAYRGFRLLHGSFERLKEQGREAMSESLQEYWETWTKGWNVAGGGSQERVLGAVPRSPLATAITTSQIAPLISQFSASNSATLPILLHGTSVLSLPPLPSSSLASSTTAPQTPDTASLAGNSRPIRPPPPPMSEADLLALVQHLQKTMVRPSSISVKPQPPPVAPPAEKEASASPSPDPASKWSTYTLGMSSYLSPPSMLAMPTMPAMPSMPAMPMPSLPSLAMPSLPSIPGLSSTPPPASTPSTGSGWRFHKSGWGGTLGLGHKRKGSKASSVASAEVSRSATPAPADESSPPSYPPLAATTKEDEASTTKVQSPTTPPAELTTDAILPGPPTPAVDLAPDVDTFALAEAMGSFTVDEAAKDALEEVEGGVVGLTQPSEEASTEGSPVQKAEKVELEEEEDVEEQTGGELVMRVFCGDREARDTEVEVRTFERGPLTLALATLPILDVDSVHWLASRSHRLLEAVETILELVLPPPPAYPHRHLRKEGQLSSSHAWPSKEESWSGKSSADQNEINAALFDCVRGFTSHPPILESLVRVSSSQWVVGRRSEELPRTAASTATTLTDVFVVLPAKIGKEGSLVDAGEELRRYDRVFS